MATYGTPTKLLSDVSTVVKRKFGDESGVQITDADILGWTNDAQVYLNARSNVLKAKATVSSVAGQAAYSFTSLYIQQIESIHYAGTRIPNMSFSQAEETVSRYDPNQEVSEDLPVLWYEWAETFTFWPVPSGVQNIDVYYTKLPTKLVNPTDVLSLPDDFFDDICKYVLAQAYELDEDWEAMQLKTSQVQQSLDMRGEESRSAQEMTYPVITVIDDF